MSYKTQRGNAAQKSLRFHAIIKKISDYQKVTYHPRGRVPPKTYPLIFNSWQSATGPRCQNLVFSFSKRR